MTEYFVDPKTSPFILNELIKKMKHPSPISVVTKEKKGQKKKLK